MDAVRPRTADCRQRFCAVNEAQTSIRWHGEHLEGRDPGAVALTCCLRGLLPVCMLSFCEVRLAEQLQWMLEPELLRDCR